MPPRLYGQARRIANKHQQNKTLHLASGGGSFLCRFFCRLCRLFRRPTSHPALRGARLKQLLQRSLDIRKIGCRRIPQDCDANAKILMHQEVSHSDHLRPGNISMARSNLFRNSSRRLPDYRKISDDGIKRLFVFFKFDHRYSTGIALDSLDGLKDIRNANFPIPRRHEFFLSQSVRETRFEPHQRKQGRQFFPEFSLEKPSHHKSETSQPV